MGTYIPAKVWRECHRKLDQYELRKQALADLKQEIISGYQGRNQTLGRCTDKGYITEEPEIGGGGSINHTKLDTAVEKLTSSEIIDLEKEIQRIEDVRKSLTPQEAQFFNLHYIQHLNIIDCHKRMNYSERRAKDFKHSIIEKTAVRLLFLK